MSPPRIVSNEEKEQKRQDILDAADHLWEKNSDAIASMSELADATGIAKGSLYLHFRSKEEIFLALHERNVHEFFKRFIDKSAELENMTTHDMVVVVREFLVNHPSFLPLAIFTHGMLERQIPLDMGIASKEKISAHLHETVNALKKHFPDLTPMLMTQSYALMLGLWQLLQPTALNNLVRERELFCAEEYLVALENGLNTLWKSVTLSETLS